MPPRRVPAEALEVAVRARARELIRGGGAIVLLSLVAVGVPVALSRLGSPLPRRLPSLDELRDGLLKAPLAWSVIVRAIAAAIWVAWGLFAAAMAVEGYGWVRGVEARRVRGAGILQTWACNLVAAAVLVLPSMPRLAPAATAVVPSRVAYDARAPIEVVMTVVATDNAVLAAATATPTTTAYVVQRHDCLWTIAERYLGDGFRYRDIVALNVDNIQPDGRRLGDPHWIYPGWILTLPPDAVGLPESPPSPANGDATPPVSPPATAAPATTSPPARSVAPSATQPRATFPAPARAVDGPISRETRTVPISRETRTVTTAAPSTTRPHAEATSKPSHQRSPGTKGSLVLGGVGATGLLAGVVLLRLDRLRLAQHRRRRRGRDLVRPDPSLEPIERRARAIAATEAARWVDLTVRYAWSALAEANGGGVESILCVRPGEFGMEVLVKPPAPPVGRFIAGPDGRTWRLDPELDLEELAELAEGQTPLLPALVTVGSTADGPLLIDLEHAGMLAVEGDEERVRAFVASRALELATAPWASDVPVYLIGGDARLGAVDLVHVVEDVEDFAKNLDGVTTLARSGLDGSTTLAARVSPENVEAWEPSVVVVAPGTASREALKTLAECAIPGRSGLAVIAAGPVAEASWRLWIGADGIAVLDPLGIVLDANVDPAMVEGMVGLLVPAAEDADIAPVIGLKPPDQPMGEEFEGEVQVLGPVVVTWAGTLPEARLERGNVLAALVAYLGTHYERPVPAQRLQNALWPLREDHPRAGEVREGTLRTTVSRARKALGTDSTGARHLPDAVGGAYFLGPRFSCDWRRFRQLMAAAHTASSEDAIDMLRRALALVRGRPFEDAPPTFGWAETEQLISHMEVAIAEAAEDLAERARSAGDTPLAIWAADQGLRALPAREALYRVKMHAAFDANDPDGIEQAYAEARRAAVAVEPFGLLQEETEHLYRRLRHAFRAGGGQTTSANGYASE